MQNYRFVICFMALGLFANDARSELADEETALIERRMKIDNVSAVVRTEVLSSGPAPSTKSGMTRSRFLDDYKLLKQNRRVDNYLAGNRDGACYRQYRKPGEAVFFTNELNQAGGKAVVEIRKVDDSLVQQDIRLIGLGIGTMRQPQRPPLRVIGANKDARRIVKSVDYEGATCAQIEYESGGVNYRALLDRERGYEPVLIETRFANNGALEQHVSRITVQSIRTGDQGSMHFPKRVEIRRIIDDAEMEHIVEEVEKLEFGSVEEDAFSMASLGIPVGQPVYDLRGGSKYGLWNGESVEYPENMMSQQPDKAPGARRLMAGTIALVLFLSALVAMKYFRRGSSAQ